MNDFETRFYTTELRMDETEESAKIIGHGAVFNKRSENLGGFREVIAPGAFDNVLNDDVRALFNHDGNFILGRTINKTLRLSIDDEGLAYEIDAPQTQTIRDLVLAPLKRGDISQSSFAFRVASDGDHWEEDDEGIVVRTVHKLSRLIDVSPVTYPAYPDAKSAARSLKIWQEAREGNAIKKALTQKSARERLLAIL